MTSSISSGQINLSLPTLLMAGGGGVAALGLFKNKGEMDKLSAAKQQVATQAAKVKAGTLAKVDPALKDTIDGARLASEGHMKLAMIGGGVFMLGAILGLMSAGSTTATPVTPGGSIPIPGTYVNNGAGQPAELTPPGSIPVPGTYLPTGSV